MAKIPSFNVNHYGIIGVLLEIPGAKFPYTEKVICKKMVQYGWLEAVEIEVPQKAGLYEYTAKFSTYSPTKEGLRLYFDLKKHVATAAQIRTMELASAGEDRIAWIRGRLKNDA